MDLRSFAEEGLAGGAGGCIPLYSQLLSVPITRQNVARAACAPEGSKLPPLALEIVFGQAGVAHDAPLRAGH
jgi:hypothetical protein